MYIYTTTKDALKTGPYVGTVDCSSKMLSTDG